MKDFYIIVCGISVVFEFYGLAAVCALFAIEYMIREKKIDIHVNKH